MWSCTPPVIGIFLTLTFDVCAAAPLTIALHMRIIHSGETLLSEDNDGNILKGMD